MKALNWLWQQLVCEREAWPRISVWVWATLRGRSLVLFGGALLVLFASLYSDPDGGLSTALGGLSISQGIWAVTAAFVLLKVLHDYQESDTRYLFTKAREGSIGSGLALVAKAISFFALVSVFAPRAHAAELPAGFRQYGPMLAAEQRHYWPGHPDPALLYALVAQETGPCPKARSCWNPKARLKSAREEGAGMGQLTRAYRADGSLRFDALAGLRKQYGDDLAELTWGNVYNRPELQFRAIVLMSRDAATPFRVAPGMLALADAAYNGGPTGVQKERRACALTRRCDPGLWFGHVELHCLKSRQPLYGSRNACDINREHVRNVVKIFGPQYKLAVMKL